MKFKISGIRGGKSQKNFLALPPLVRDRLLYLRFFSGALVPTIRNRWSVKGMGPDYQKVDKFFNSGGMWRGLTSRITGTRAGLSFTKSSLPTGRVMALRRRLSKLKKKPNSKTAKEVLQRYKELGRLKKIGNRKKAKTAQGSTHVPILQPSRDETNCLVTWMEEHIERGVLINLENVKNLNKRAIPDRFNQLLKRLPNPKNKR